MKLYWVKNTPFLLVAITLLASCSKENDLPVFGEREVVGTDTVYHTIAPFQFVDQDSAVITNANFKDQIYVADFSLPRAAPFARS